MKKSLIVPITLTFLLGACSLTNQKPVEVPTPAPKLEEAVVPTPDTAMEKTTPTAELATETKSYTATEVAEHANGQSCWLILDSKVYDVTTFIGKHPGGEAILKGCGKDATKMFSKHPESAKAMKEQFYIGDLKA